MTQRPPRAVREAAERAEEAHARAYPGEQTEPPQSPPETPQTPESSSGPPDTPKPETAPPEPAPAPPAPPPAPPEETVDFWRNKFRTLEGKYRAEVPRQASQLREASARIQSLEQTLASMATPSDNKSLVTQEEVEEYGEDFVSMMRRLAQEEAGRAVEKVTPRIDQVAGQVHQATAQTQTERVYAMLDQDVEDWRSINRLPAFLDWLAEEDPFVGETRSVLLRDAFDQKDGRRVVNFFRGFVSQQQALQPQPKPADEPQTSQARTQPKVTLDSLVGPRSSGGGAPQAEADDTPQPWTRRQIASFYKDVQLGVYKNDPDKRNRIERSINRASVNGLITP